MERNRKPVFCYARNSIHVTHFSTADWNTEFVLAPRKAFDILQTWGAILSGHITLDDITGYSI